MVKNAWRVKVSLLTIVFLLLTGCGGGTDNTAPAPTPAPAPGPGTQPTVNAEAVFKQNCVSCHGNDLEGRMGGNTNLQKVGARRSRDQIVTQIQNGGNGMPPFKGNLTDQQINALADWLAAKK